MLYEINQIKRFLADAYNLQIEPDGTITAHVPDGEHVIPLGHSDTPHKVKIEGGKIFIGEAVESSQ